MYRSVFRFASGKNFGRTTYIVAAKRTPIGSFLGKFSKLSGVELGAIAVRAAIESIKLDPTTIDEVLLGNVVSAGQGQAPARQVAMKGGVDKHVPCTTINKVCSSGMKTVMLGASSIGLGLNDIVLAGGFESMSNAPFYVTNVSFEDYTASKGLPLRRAETPRRTGLRRPYRCIQQYRNGSVC